MLAEKAREIARGRMKGLLVDFGGVLTTNVFESFRDFCVKEGLEAEAFLDLFRDEPGGAQASCAGWRPGEIDEDEFGEILGRDARGGGPRWTWWTGCSPACAPDVPMVDAVRAREGRRRDAPGLVSNSIGAGRYDRSQFPEMFDGVVISAEVGMHKPQPEIFRLGAERVGLPPEECVFVDDLRENCEGAEAVGMTAVLHRGADTTIPRLEELLGVKLT